ncbi:terminase large subunit domain-containing protein [Paractinoplanes durhamensis]|uniref:Terminase n=1 Tax=Paractinoplanes durhamensis TaxID=113563 RepID=A0ABQ3ZBT7_9ACTN|nr:terminase family protein [Actinoplanes durhamensis]GIE07299.1 hypothetical protein Adu01nite_86490 [Actinoplanes durhamensis]
MTTTTMPAALQEGIWARLGWQPHSLQREVLESQARYQVVSAGRRAGKTQMGAYRVLPEWFRALRDRDILKARGHRREFWIVGPEYSDAEKEFRVTWDALKRLGVAFETGSANTPQSGTMRIVSLDGRFVVEAKSAKYPETLVGEGLSGVVLAEAAKLKRSVWDRFVRPTLADFGGWAVFTSTPEGRNWFYDLWAAGQDPTRPEWASWRAPAWVNPHVYRSPTDPTALATLAELRDAGQLPYPRHLTDKVNPEVLEMFLSMSAEAFDQEIAAQFNTYVGRVFKGFNEEVHVTNQDFIPGWYTYAAADFGFTNPFVWLVLQVDPHRERVHIVREYYETGRTTEEAAVEIEARGLTPPGLLGFFPDPAEPDRAAELVQRLRLRRFSPGSLTIADRIEWIRRKLGAQFPLEHARTSPGLTINRRCLNTIREFNAYRYPDTATSAADRGRAPSENPKKVDDHTIEALGRFFSGFYGRPNTRGGGRQSHVHMRR